MHSIFLCRIKRFIILFLVGYTTTLLAVTDYQNESYDFGLRIGTGALSGIDNSVLPLLDISTDFYFLSPKIRMVFGVSYIYPNNNTNAFSVAGLQYLGIEYNFPFLKNMAQLGIKTTKTYLKNKSSAIDNNRSISVYLGYKHSLREHLDSYIQFGTIKKPVKEISSTIKIDDYSLLLQSGLVFYF